LSEISCDEVLTEIEHYLHGELDQRRTALLGEHLADCPPCFERAEFQRKLKEIVRVKCQCQAPEYLVARIRQAISVEYGGTDEPRSDSRGEVV
jgi:anti-sigma factor (TIGR02949 family)